MSEAAPKLAALTRLAGRGGDVSPRQTSPGEAALGELREKSIHDIQRETAFKWAWRAWAAMKLAGGSRGTRLRAQYRKDASEYAHEAIEHAALAEDGGEVLAEVRRIAARAL